MKKQILLLSLLFSLFVSCVKEDETGKEDGPLIAKNSQRITRVSRYNYEGVITSQTRYTYDGENLIKVSNFFDNSGELSESTRSEFTYSLNEITRLDTRRGDNFQQAGTKYVYKFIDGKQTELVRFIYNGGVFDEKEKTTYTYLNGKLSLISSRVKMIDNIVHEYERVKFTYENDKLKGYSVLASMSNGWEDQTKIDLFYENGKLVKTTVTNLETGSWNLKATAEYFYNGDDITTITSKHSDVTEPVIYKYENNYLVEIFLGIDTMIYEYEAGHGNASVVLGGPTAPLFVGQTIR